MSDIVETITPTISKKANSSQQMLVSIEVFIVTVIFLLYKSLFVDGIDEHCPNQK